VAPASPVDFPGPDWPLPATHSQVCTQPLLSTGLAPPLGQAGNWHWATPAQGSGVGLAVAASEAVPVPPWLSATHSQVCTHPFSSTWFFSPVGQRNSHWGTPAHESLGPGRKRQNCGNLGHGHLLHLVQNEHRAEVLLHVAEDPI